MARYDRDELIEIENAKLIHSTDRAGKYLIDGEECWIPFSILDAGSVDRDGETGSVYVPFWFAEKEGLA